MALMMTYLRYSAITPLLRLCLMPNPSLSAFDELAHLLTPQATQMLFDTFWPSARYPNFKLLYGETVQWLPEPVIIGRYPHGSVLEAVGITNRYGPYGHESLIILMGSADDPYPHRFASAIKNTNGYLLHALELDREISPGWRPTSKRPHWSCYPRSARVRDGSERSGRDAVIGRIR